MTNIEQLKKETDEIKKWLEDLKNNVSLSETDKKNKVDDLKSKAETTKQKIENEIHSLENKTDDESKRKKEEAETLLNSFNETMTLYTSILSSTESKSNSENSEDKKEDDNEEKWIFWKVGDWLWEQWDDVTSWEKWKEEPWKNILRVAWVWLTWYAVYKWVKKLWNRAFWDDEEEWEDEEEKEETKKKKKKKSKETSRWKKFLIWAGITTWTVVWWVSIYKNWNRISSWVKEKLWKALNFEEAMYTVETEVRNWINSDDNFWEFSAHFEGMSYDESTHEISSFWQKTKINKSNKSIEWMDDVQFASWEELFHAVNIVNFAKSELRWRWANETPFSINSRTWDIDFKLSESWKSKFIWANWSNFWTWVLWLWWAWWGWLLWGYFLWLKWWLAWAVAWWLSWYTLWSVIDNTSTMWRACWAIAKWANLQKFVKYLNEQNIWWEQKEIYEPDDTTPIHKYLNKVKHEIDDAYWDWAEDSGRRDLKVERNESTPDTYKIKSYYQEITLKLDWCTAKKWEEIDFSKINNIHIEKYEKISGKKIDSRWDWLDIKFPSTEKWIEEAIRTANLTNKIVKDWRREWWESYPFFRWKYTTPPCLDMDTDWFRWKTILSRDSAKLIPTLFEDLKKWSNWWIWSTVWYTKNHQREMHDQARQDKNEWSQYIKFLHQIGEWKFWKKVW